MLSRINELSEKLTTRGRTNYTRSSRLNDFRFYAGLASFFLSMAFAALLIELTKTFTFASLLTFLFIANPLAGAIMTTLAILSILCVAAIITASILRNYEQKKFGLFIAEEIKPEYENLRAETTSTTREALILLDANIDADIYADDPTRQIHEGLSLIRAELESNPNSLHTLESGGPVTNSTHPHPESDADALVSSVNLAPSPGL